MSVHWRILYHPAVEKDLTAIGRSRAKRVLQAIEAKLGRAPEKFGAPLRKGLTGLRKLRVGDVRVVYRLEKKSVDVFVVVVGRRADEAVYKVADARVDRDCVCSSI